jgi:hypothetical protein
VRENTGKKSHPTKFCSPKISVYQTDIFLPGRFVDAGSGNFGQIIDSKNTDLMMRSIPSDLVAKMAGAG